jgi:RNA polymerase sigma factor (sigma-70 family)
MKNKINLKSIFLFLIGPESEFDPESRFLNITCLLISFSYFITFPVNLLFGMSFTISFINLIVSVTVALLYYLSRFKRMFIFSTVIMIIFVFVSLSVDWFLNGGIISGISYYFFSLLVVILFLFNGLFRNLLSVFLIILVITLFILEYFYPQWIVSYSSRQQMFLDHSTNFIVAGPFIILAVYFSKQLYLKEKQNTIDIIETYRKSSEFLKRQMDEKLKVLSIREREIFKLIIEGKTNKEIADLLFISVETVKKHINTLFKKLGAKKRTELLDTFINYQES